MPVNLTIPTENELKAVPGIKLGYAMANIRKPNRKDLLVMQIDEGASVSGVFTTNKFCAAPVKICQNNLNAVKKNTQIRALVINTGNANAGTGASGMEHALLTCSTLATKLNLQSNQILPFSTGVILEPLPIDKILNNLDAAIQSNASWLDAANCIMTTDTQPKAYSKTIDINDEQIIVTGISKGAGMIKPNMATMLGFIATNANIEQQILDEIIKEIADESFNCITIDGDTSTNDSFILISTNKCSTNHSDNPEYLRLIKNTIKQVSIYLAQAIVRDGEGATKFMSIRVKNVATKQDGKLIAYAIAHSPLVKTAFFASDPNLGRILAAIGYSSASFDIDNMDIALNGISVIKNGSRDAVYTEEQGAKIMQESEISIDIDVKNGIEKCTVWTCDLSHEYVSINASYRS
jgi:glutamate N-acetyltransferase / amino-acid N-acetyltransferase